MKKTLSIVLALVLALACLSTAAFADDNTIVVGASSTPHAEILEVVKEALAEEGYTLEIVVYDDYVLPNQALYDGELDANYFQHTPTSIPTTPPTTLTWSPQPSSTTSPSAFTATV